MGNRIVKITGTVISPGEAEGTLLVGQEPLSFWGGYDQQTGEIIDRRHHLSGHQAAGSILAIPFTRGSSTTTAILLESVRAGVAPAGLITTGVDHFTALASIVADELYQKPIPIIGISEEDYARLNTGDRVRLLEHGIIEFLH